ncbi:MAG: tRNA 2-thiocytidine biosynthesis protein TtcA [Thermodesulfatator sp.]|nr:MAG: tRNA 2-thiocytidine biosynthesis protein TtcA [Thermodesulfatator sp.]
MALYHKLKRLIGRALHRYEMLSPGDRILLALSGGADSLVLAYFLAEWRRKVPFSYEILALHLDMGFSPGPEYTRGLKRLAEFCERLEIPFQVLSTDCGQQALKAAERGKPSPCFVCSWHRRKHLFRMAGQQNFRKIAFGHHRDDLVVTFFLNLCFHGELSTLVPVQEMFQGKLYLIRPLIFCEKSALQAFARKKGFPVLENPCPLSRQSRRAFMERWLEEHLYTINPKVRGSVFRALFNWRPEYLPR